MRLIDADALEPEVYHIGNKPIVEWKDVQKQPTIDAVPVRRGKWVMVKRGEQHHNYQCSECGFYLITSEKTIRKEKYCIHCGAKMDGGEE